MTDQLTAEQAAAQAELLRRTATLRDAGIKQYGEQAFNEAANTVVDALGNRADQFAALLSEASDAPGVVMELAKDERRLKNLATLDVTRQAFEIGAIDRQKNPHGYTGNMPQYLDPKVRVINYSEQQWSRTFGDEIKDDKDWNRLFDRMEERRAKRKGWR